MVLAPEAAGDWRLRALDHIPRYSAHARLLLRERGAVVPRADICGRAGAIVWSPDARRLALATMVDEPADDAPGSAVTRYVARLIEPRHER